MTINKLPWVFLFMAFLTFSCGVEMVEPTTTDSNELNSTSEAKGSKSSNNCTSDFYYYNKEKVILGPVLTHKIIIGFLDTYTLKQKAAFVAENKLLKEIESEFNTGSADATIVLLRAGLTCGDVKDLLTQLEEKAEVRYATPFYESGQENSIMGITNQFIVNVKPNTDLAYLQQLASKTNTRIIEQLGDFTYILSADKNADGNALEMANYFSVQPRVESSEPDFLYIYNSSFTVTN